MMDNTDLIISNFMEHSISLKRVKCLTLGTCGLNSTALCMASTAVISAVLRPRFEAMSGENLGGTEINLNFE